MSALMSSEVKKGVSLLRSDGCLCTAPLLAWLLV
jgi:hypothetical protein